MKTRMVIQARDIGKRYLGSEEPVLHGCTLDLSEGELAVLIGPSGCGKTTLLRCLNGLERFDTGSLEIAGIAVSGIGAPENARRHSEREFRELRRRVGFVFQQFNLFPHLSALSNVALAPMKVRGMSREKAEHLALRLLDKVGLKDHARSFPEQMSGGQQQRVAIARSLAMEPRVILFDEPTSSLDPTMADEVLNVMRALRKEGITQVVVTHEMDFAREAADVVCFMYEGSIHERGAPRDIFRKPAKEETRAFLKKFLDKTPSD